MIVLDHKVATGDVLYGDGMRQLITGTARRCVPSDTPMLKSVRGQNGGLREHRFHLGDCEESLLYRGGSLQRCCKAHVCPAVTNS